MGPVSLEEALSQAIRQDVNLVVRHVVGAPTPCPPIFSPPVGEPVEATICKQHFLAVSINTGHEKEIDPDQHTEGDNSSDANELLVFAIEVLVYTTDKLSTLFVSKADSTGYLSLLNRDPDSPAAYSLTRNVLSVFLYYLVRIYQRPDVNLVLSLFARAQDQYLFPGSSENKGKHILDDRGLIKWWCRVIDPVMQCIELEGSDTGPRPPTATSSPACGQSVTSHLIVPGCDTFETRNFLPKNERANNGAGGRWRLNYPLHQICSYPDAPPRCLVPRFPDDPKARFLIDLDDEITEEDPPHGLKNSGQWHSVKSLDQFWEMMSYRQECSAGRLVGFLWMIVKPLPATIETAVEKPPTTTDSAAKDQPPNGEEEETKGKSAAERSLEAPENDRDGSIIPISNSDYKGLSDYLLDLDFSNQHDATINTKLWVEELSSLTGCPKEGLRITGKGPLTGPPPTTSTSSTGESAVATNLLSGGIIRKRKRQPSIILPTPGESTTASSHDSSTSQQEQQGSEAVGLDPKILSQEQSAPIAPVVNVLSGTLIRKKRK
ncbi:uncharacterized protein GIQ15_06731 [Arthroderma uncinatum]|uniref:uncharacterized protein n=1 Tax=Arthroderma uncinatum TaxID=74035 RepID=UPI00144A66C6|nr:uncharacterized protein GIQ15_06731 [Arthroderma uncinatum]KAF3479755.1 hypothetical protein GIQ15_06731 [Arthroderma uncinatum]